MKHKCWKKSPTDSLWYYKPHPIEIRTPTNPASETINAVKFGTEYKVYATKGSLSNWKMIGKVKNKPLANRLMNKYMKEHDKC